MRIAAGLDIETTGLLEPSQRIIEFGAILFDIDSGKKLGSYVQRINPQRPIEPKAQEVHGITFEDVAHCPLFEEVADKIVTVLQKSEIVVAHNGMGFDLPFIAKELRRVGKAMPTVQVIDTMLDGRWATPFGKVPNLGELSFSCRVQYDTAKAHGALYDVEVMMDSFFKARSKGFFQQPQTFVG